MDWYEVTRWYAYRRIEHPSMRFYHRTFPLTFGTLVTLVVIFAPEPIALSNLMGKMISATSLLPGFYVASLAAVSTFAGIHIDETMPDPAPKLYIKTNQTDGDEELTRRMFLCYLFGYLAVISLLFVFLGSAIQLVTPSAKSVLALLIPAEIADPAMLFIKGVVVFMMSSILGSVFITTLQGVYYLMERIFQPS